MTSGDNYDLYQKNCMSDGYCTAIIKCEDKYKANPLPINCDQLTLKCEKNTSCLKLISTPNINMAECKTNLNCYNLF